MKEISRDMQRHGKEIEGSLQDITLLLEKVFETITDALFVLNPDDLSIITCNQAATDTFGHPKQDLVGSDMALLFVSPETHRRFTRKLLHQVDQKRLFQAEVPMRTKNGSTLFCEQTVKAAVDATGKRICIVSAVRDISEKKRDREKIERYVKQLEQTNRELEAFTYMASHDLQEPLRKIQLFGDRLKNTHENALGPEGVDYLKRMIGAAEKMQRLIQDLLSYSRIMSKPKTVQAVDMNQIVTTALSNLEPLVQGAGGRLETGGPLPVIEADPDQMLHLVQNLIENAFKFHRKNMDPVVRVSARIFADKPGQTGGAPRREWCEIKVSDNGIGFDEQYVERIFQPFERLHGLGQYQGTGIGLAICRKVVEGLGGRISATSTPGRGSMFSVTLPVKKGAHQNPAPGAGKKSIGKETA